MLRNVSLFLLQADTAIDGAKLYPPCVVEIAGLHLKDPTPLDEELQSIMDNAKSGVVYFSYGSVVKMSHLPREMIEAFLTTFERLDQVVLWKTDLDTTDVTIPRNVHVKRWFAQTGILAHPNCKLFVTHGGLSSMMEAVRAGVPVVGTSFYGDQIINLANAEYLAVMVYTYKENALRRSAIFNDKPMPPLENAVYWIEYVIRHKGAHHLKPIAAHIPWDMLFHFDVYHLFLATILAPICALCMEKKRIRNEKVREVIGVGVEKDIVHDIRSKQLVWHGHVRRMADV
ncbi:unnamed protein product [Bemisia tabaci]|uniref:Glucuronosyltransferase n=1 Tax=Bemisia tabaci TaxID=7038 RepID=A0A9P0F0A5_BEMTA|nr:unnamed protein product [Bemisia tabaci]